MSNNQESRTIQSHLLADCVCMLEHALSNGKSVAPAIVSVVQSFQDMSSKTDVSTSVDSVSEVLQLDQLVDAHDQLVKLVVPATPESLRYMQSERNKKSAFKFLSDISFIRQLWVAAVISFVLLMIMAPLEYVSFTSGEEVLSYDGFPMLANFLFFMAAAGLGASIKELYEAQKFTTTNTFHPKFMSSYWIRFTLGITSGIVLAFLIPIDVQGSSEEMKGVAVLAKPTIALLGGFSSSFVYKLLDRLVESLEFLVGSKPEQVKKVEDHLDEVQGKYEDQSNRVTRYIAEIQEMVASGADSDALKKLLQKMTDKFIPPVDSKELVSSAASPMAEEDPEISEDEEKFRRFEYQMNLKGPIERINPDQNN